MVSIKNLRLEYWKRSIFEAIWQNLGRLVSIAAKLHNFIDCSIALIEVKNNIFGFVPAEIIVKDDNFSNFSFRFGDITYMDTDWAMVVEVKNNSCGFIPAEIFGKDGNVSIFSLRL